MQLQQPPRKSGQEQAARGRAAAAGTSVPLVLDGAPSALQPVTVGVPFPRGAMYDPHCLALFDADGRPAPLQAQALARWADGSVKWLLLDFLAAPAGHGPWRWDVRATPSSPDHGGSHTLRLTESQGAWTVDTGAAVFSLGRGAPLPFARVVRDGRDLLDPPSVRTVLTDAKGRAGLPRVERVEPETVGPVRTTVRLEGTFSGRVPCRFVARCCFFAGTGLVRFRLTVHNPNRARHRGGLWDLGDAGSMFFRDLSTELGLSDGGPVRAVWTAEAGRPARPLAGGDLEVYQDSSGGENWRSRNHVNRHGRVPCSFRGYRARHGGAEERGLRAAPVVALASGPHRLTAAVPEFWQQFPKAVEVSGRRLRVRLFPRQFGDLFELQGGERKSHTVWLDFGSADGPPALHWAHQPLAAHATPEWYAASGALPFLTPAGPARPADALCREVVDGPDSFFAKREVIDEYGWRNFGEVYADHEAAYYAGPKPVVSHYNNQYDVVHGLLLQYFRTGDRRWLGLLDPLARHVIDIDVYHTDRDKAAYNGGLFWFTDHYKDAAACTHRTFSRANCRPGDRSYGGGPGSAHNFATGLLHYHYLTGDPEARSAVLSLADWVVRMEDGGRNLLGLIDDGPTGLASFTGEPDYHGPGRGPGLSVNALIDGWLASGRRAYLDKAEELIRRCAHPADDVAARGLLDVERRWSYTVFLSALARYLDVKQELGELDFAYAHARGCLLRYAGWMLEHEVPYFDRPEKLEYPTETWAAQELRKANVLRLATAHAEEPLRGRLLGRGDELADRAWRDLSRFESRTAARAVAIVMVEGTADSFFRGGAVPLLPRPAADFDFGSPENFVPQKRRVREQLRSVRGLARAALRLADVRRWGRLFRRDHESD